MALNELGWQRYTRKQPLISSNNLSSQAPSRQNVGRVGIENKTNFVLHSEHGELEGIIQGKFRHTAKKPSDFPKVGDWVIFSKLDNEDKAIIEKIMPRYSVISRKSAGDSTDEQIIAANVDSLFIVFGLDKEFNAPLLERYLSMAYEGGVTPIVILNKTDRASSPKVVSQTVALAQSLAPALVVIPISATSNESLRTVERHIEPGRTITFVGPSGVGKSTIINALIGSEVQTTAEVRLTDSKGRHTTTRRELFILPSGGILIDTPGIRELETISSEDALENVFTDIIKLALECEYGNCDHIKSDGCAVLEALHAGKLSKERYDNFIKLTQEQKDRESY